MRTPRKRVLPIHRPLLIEEPLQDQTPEWAEHIRLWSREQGLEDWIRATTSQVMDVGATAEVTAARLRRLDETHGHTSGIRNIERRAEEAEREAADLRAQVDALRGAGRS
ncbi:hypothetical protein L2E82_10212 [Cichorium intybus]|uniref:Uncharacterized protein n=1 Tax=Cichorium intybus TaxID=13427 RepID=A0ACB9GAZ7_CICIN|nr:hypothetical protein L2E82_10212 [Cichorium intybus]